MNILFINGSPEAQYDFPQKKFGTSLKMNQGRITPYREDVDKVSPKSTLPFKNTWSVSI